MRRKTLANRNWNWQEDAACRHIPGAIDIFFGEDPETGEERNATIDRAKAICATCHVREPCLDFAERNRIPEGVWGGKAASERRRSGFNAQAAARRERVRQQRAEEREAARATQNRWGQTAGQCPRCQTRDQVVPYSKTVYLCLGCNTQWPREIGSAE